MLQKFKNKQGEILMILALVTGVAATTSLTYAVGKHIVDGTAKRNGKVIWCKMQGNDADLCNAKYGYAPKS